MTVQPIEDPARTALLRLLATDDNLPTDRKAVALINRPGVLVVIVDTPRAWGCWVYAVRAASKGATQFHRGGHLFTAENTVGGYPVQIVKAPAYPAECARLVRAA